MKLIKTGNKRGEFDVLVETRAAQGAMMTLAAGSASDEQPSNEHPRSEQWLFVISGSGTATVVKDGRRRSAPLGPGTLVVIERGELHQIKQRGRHPLRTITFYLPPAYDANGKVRARSKR